MNEEASRLKKRGADKENPLLFRIAKYTAIGLQFPSMVAGGFFLGYLLDLYFNTSPLLMAILTLLALLGGFFQLFRLLKYFSKKED